MAVDMFLKIDALEGESRDKANAGWIDILAWSWGMSNSGTAHLGGGAGAGKVNVQDLSVTKYIDKSSADLMLACCTGKHFDKADLKVRKAGEGQHDYIVITMNEVLISAVSTGGSGGEDRLTENLTLNFGKVKFLYNIQDAKGAVKKGGECTYNIAENIKE